jgi:hypothetical protein
MRNWAASKEDRRRETAPVKAAPIDALPAGSLSKSGRPSDNQSTLDIGARRQQKPRRHPSSVPLCEHPSPPLPLPFNIADDQKTGDSVIALTPRPNYVSGCQVQVDKVNEWFNPDCFTLEAPVTLGNLGRDTARGPKFVDTDFAVLKSTKLVESVNLQFRAEFFNIFNHTNLGLPIAGLGGAALFADAAGDRIGSASQITSMVGTPRVIQFALKLIF